MDQNQCRTCLNSSFIHLSIFKKVNGVSVDKMLELLTNLKVSKNDIFSKTICKECYNETVTAFAFRKKCLESDKVLKSKHKSKTATSTIKEEEFEFNTANIKMEVDDFIEESHFASHDYEDNDNLSTTKDENEDRKEIEISNVHCTYCEPVMLLMSEFQLERHLFDEHGIGTNPLICQTCNIEFKFKPNDSEELITLKIREHMDFHNEGKLHSCFKCYEVFKTLKELKKHDKCHKKVETTKTTQIKCKSCSIEFDNEEHLNQHLEQTSCKELINKTFQCYICNTVFNTFKGRKLHIQDDHKDKVGADCPLCLRCKIPSAVAYEKHYRTHFVAPRFCCSYCGQGFHESDRLQTHIRRFHDTIKFICFWCNKSFKDKSGVRRHINAVHLNTRKYKCQYCSKLFTANYNLKEHLFAVHKTASKVYKCELCNQDFLYRKQYERHRNVCDGSGLDKRVRRKDFYDSEICS